MDYFILFTDETWQKLDNCDMTIYHDLEAVAFYEIDYGTVITFKLYNIARIFEDGREIYK